jgi:hypothetical protein
MVGRHSVENKIQGLLNGLETLWILGDDKLIRANLHGRLPLAGRGGDGHHGVAHGLGQPDAHLAEAAHAHHAHAFTTGSGLPRVERREHGDACTEDGARRLQGVALRDLRNEQIHLANWLFDTVFLWLLMRSALYFSIPLSPVPQQGCPRNKQKKIRFALKQTETRSVSVVFRFVL